MPLRRRTVLALGSAGLLAGCSGRSAPGPTATATSPTTATTSPASPTRSAPPWHALSRHLHGSLVRPDDKNYAGLKRVENPRYDDARPLALLRAKSANDVQTGLKFAADHDVPIAVRSGGHNYAGWSAGGADGTGVPRSLVIDVRRLDSITMDGASASIGAGAELIDVYAGVARKGRALAAGSCPTVGVTGLTLGGGVGVLTRNYGLTCDQVESIDIVTADGKLRTIDDEHDPDLFWACRGGGGGQYGVVTGWRFATSAAPSVSVFFMQFPASRAVPVIDAWQRWAPKADKRLWSTCKYLSGAAHSTPVLKVAGTWVGTSGLNDALDEFVAEAGEPTSRSVGSHSYLKAMLIEAGCSKLGVRACHIGHGGELTREMLSATSHIATTRLDESAIGELTDAAERARSIDGLIEGGVSLDSLGGEVAATDSAATAFPYRDGLATVQYTATWHADKENDGSRFDDYVHRLRTTMVPSWGQAAYVNYADPRLGPKAYFNGNLDKLKQVHDRYDPDGLFDQPKSVR